MKITMHGNPLTLVGTPIKTGETAPVFYGINQQMQPVSLKEFAGKVVVISSFPSIDTPVCSAQMHHFNKMASELSQDVVILAISFRPSPLLCRRRYRPGHNLVGL